MRLFLPAVLLMLMAGCATAGTGSSVLPDDVSPDVVVFEVQNGNYKSLSAVVYIGPDCRSAERRIGEIMSGSTRRYIMRTSDFGSGFVVRIELKTPSGLDIVQEACSDNSQRPYGRSRVLVHIPGGLEYLVAPGIFPLR